MKPQAIGRAWSIAVLGLLFFVALALASSSSAVAAPSVTVSGRVVDGSGHAVANVNVSAYQGGTGSTCCTWVTAVNTDSLGSYTVSLSPGTYRLQFYPPSSLTFVGRWYSTSGTARLFDQASDIDATTSALLSDVALETGALISGTVTNAVAGINVSAYTSGTCCTWVSGTATDSSGNYSFRVPSGTYRLQFYPPTSASLIPQWWNNTASGAQTFDLASDITVATSDVTGTNATLVSGHKITGHITSDGTTAIAGASAQVFTGGSIATCCTWVSGSSTDANGAYTVLVPDGTYRLQFLGPRSSAYISQWWNGGTGAARFEQASDITVSADVTRDATLQVGRRVSGHVTDGTSGIAGAGVSAFTGGASATCCTWVAGTGTASDGSYSIIVPAGTYRLQFQGPRGGTSMAQWWTGTAGGASRFDLATDVDLTTLDRTARDAVLASGVSISGRVTDASGSGIAHVGIGAFLGGSSAVCCTWVGGVGTDSQGRYGLVLPSNTYRLSFFSPSGTSYVSQWWNGGSGATDFDRATDITLTTALTGYNVTLTSGARISGTVTSGSTGISGAFVSAFSGGGSAVCCTWVAAAPTDAAGHYSLAVPSGTYRLMFGGSRTSGVISRWYNGGAGATGFNQASDVTVAGGGSMAIDMTLATGLTISGRVTDGSGNGIAFVGVGAFQGGSSAACCSWLAGTGTDPNGNYTLVVPSGTYRVSFFPPLRSAYTSQWWDGSSTGVSRFDQAADIVVNASVSGKNATLASGRRITGRVTDAAGNAVPNAFVGAFSGGSASCCTWLAGAPTDGSGRYTLVVTNGTYRLQAFPPPTTPLISQWWTSTGGATNFGAADDIGVSGDVSGKDFSLSSGVTIRGRVVDGSGNGIPQVFVGAFNGGSGATCCTWVGGAPTDGTGNFSLVVPPGTYRLQFWPPRGSPFIGHWWKASGGASRFDVADDIVAATSLTGKGATLASGFTISGRVTDGTNGIPNVNVAAFLGGNGATCCTWLNGTGTDASGNYSLSVPAGTYRLKFFPPPGSSFVSQFWMSGAPPNRTGSFTNASDITVGPSATGTNIVLATGNAITGTVTSDGTHGIQGVNVSAFTGCPSSCQWLAGTATNPDGTYSLVVPAGTGYMLSFNAPPGSPFISQWWNGAAGPSSATAFDVSGPVSGKNAVLATGIVVSGRVTDSGGNGVPNANVNAMTGCPSSCSWAAGTNTSPTGTYSLVVAANTYRVQFNAPQGSSFIGHWWDGTSAGSTSSSGATDVTVGASAVTGINATLATGFRIQGTVTDGTNAVASSNVIALTGCPSSCTFAAGADTGATGAFTLVVPSGSYDVKFNTPTGTHLIAHWWDGTTTGVLSVSGATAVTVGTSDVTGIGATLATGWFIQGTVTKASDASNLAGINVTVLDCTGTCTFVGSTWSATDGTYTVVVPNGTYKLRFSGTGYSTQFWNNKATSGLADPVTVSGLDLTGKSAAMAP